MRSETCMDKARHVNHEWGFVVVDVVIVLILAIIVILILFALLMYC